MTREEIEAYYCKVARAAEVFAARLAKSPGKSLKALAKTREGTGAKPPDFYFAQGGLYMAALLECGETLVPDRDMARVDLGGGEWATFWQAVDALPLATAMAADACRGQRKPR